MDVIKVLNKVRQVGIIHKLSPHEFLLQSIKIIN